MVLQEAAHRRRVDFLPGIYILFLCNLSLHNSPRNHQDSRSVHLSRLTSLLHPSHPILVLILFPLHAHRIPGNSKTSRFNTPVIFWSNHHHHHCSSAPPYLSSVNPPGLPFPVSLDIRPRHHLKYCLSNTNIKSKSQPLIDYFVFKPISTITINFPLDFSPKLCSYLETFHTTLPR